LNIMTCRFCGEDRKLIKAHIIPAGFFRILRHGQIPPQMLTTNENEYTKRMPIGVYDKNILCEICEPLFGVWDNYAQQLLGLEPKGSSPIINQGEIYGYEIQKYNYELLKLFFISLLWRASLSKHIFYSKVNLGLFEHIAKRFIEHNDPGTPEDFSVTLAKFDHPIGKTILDPHPEKPEGINYYRFYFGSYIAYIKVDKRNTTGLHIDFMMKPGKPLQIIRRNLHQSKELPLIHDIVLSDNKGKVPTR